MNLLKKKFKTNLVLAKTRKIQIFVLIIPLHQLPTSFADLKLAQNMNLEFLVLIVVSFSIITCCGYFLVKEILFKIKPSKYLEYSELMVSLCAIGGMIILGVVIVLYVVVSPELLGMLLRIRFGFKLIGFIGAGTSLCLTGIMIKKQGWHHFMYHLFFGGVEGFEKPYGRSCIIVLILISLVWQEILCRYSDYTEYEAMIIVVGLMNIVLGVLYLYIKQNFASFFGVSSENLEIMKKSTEVTPSLLPERNLEVTKLPVRKKNSVYKQHLLLGNPLLKSRGINTWKVCCTHKRGMETTTNNESLGKLGDILGMNVHSDRFLGNTEEVLGGLERKMLVRTGNVLQPLSFMDGPTKANMTFRVFEMQSRRDVLLREPRIWGAPEWTSPQYKLRLLNPQIERAKTLQHIDKINQPRFMELSGLDFNKSLKYGLCGANESMSAFNTLVKYNKKYQAGVAFFSAGAAVTSIVKANLG